MNNDSKTATLYHLICKKCGIDWWSSNGFAEICNECAYENEDDQYKPVKNGTWTDGFTDYDRYCCRKCGQHLKMMFGPKEDIHWCPKCGNPVKWY